MRRRDGAGRVLDYSYDAGGRLERVMADGELLARVERDFAARTMSAHGPAAQRRHRRRDLAGDGHRDTSIVTIGSRTRTRTNTPIPNRSDNHPSTLPAPWQSRWLRDTIERQESQSLHRRVSTSKS